jgi:tape measure domain-containing protein
MAADLELALRIRADVAAARQDIAGLRQDVQRFGGGADKAGSDARRLGQSLDQANRSTNALGGSMRQLRTLVAALGVAQLVRQAVDAGLAMERMERGLLAATGSAEGASSAIAFLRSESQRLGLDLSSTGQQFAALAAAARGTALEGQGARDIFTAIAEASTVMGLSADQTAGALLAVQQIISKGTVSAEELRGQLGERLPGAFQVAARALGVTTSELGNMLQAGEVVADDFLPRFAAELRRTFGGALPQAVNGAQAQINRFRNAVFDAQVAFANSGFLDGLTEGLTGFAEALGDPQIQSGLAALGRGLGDLITLAGRAARHVDELRTAVLTYGGVVAGGRLGASIGALAGPQGAAIGGAVGIVAGGTAGFVTGRNLAEPGNVATGPIERTAPPADNGAADEARRRAQADREAAAAAEAAQAAADAAATADEQRAQAIAQLVAGLREEADTYGLTAEQVTLYRLRQLGASQATLDAAAGLADHLGLLREQAEFAQRAAEAEAERQRALEAALESDRELLEGLAEELRLSTLSSREQAQQAAVRRLSAEATDEQRRAVEALAGALYDQQQAARDTGDQMSEFAIQAARNIQSAFADFLFDPFSQGLQGMLSGFVDVLRRMASEAIASKIGERLFGDLLKTGASAAAGGGDNGLLGGLLAGLFHTGGVAGVDAAPGRRVPAVMYALAPRYHGGGIAGLAPDEVPAVLRRNEEVLTRDDPRHRFNGGIASAPPQVTVRNVNLFDTQVIGDYLSTSAGEKVVLNVVSRNKAALGIS